MSLTNYKPVTFYAGLNRVLFADTNVEIPMDTPLYYMLPVGTLDQIKEANFGTINVRSGLNHQLLLGNVHNVQLYYDTHGHMTIPEKQMLLEIGRKGPGGTKNNQTRQLPPDIQRYIGSFGGKRKTKSNRTNKRRKTKRR